MVMACTKRLVRLCLSTNGTNACCWVVLAYSQSWRYGRAATMFCSISGQFAFYALASHVWDELMSFRSLALFCMWDLTHMANIACFSQTKCQRKRRTWDLKMLSIHGCIQVYIMSPKKGIYLHIYSHMCMYPYRQMCVCIRYVIRNKNAICVCRYMYIHNTHNTASNSLGPL